MRIPQTLIIKCKLMLVMTWLSAVSNKYIRVLVTIPKSFKFKNKLWSGSQTCHNVMLCRWTCLLRSKTALMSSQTTVSFINRACDCSAWRRRPHGVPDQFDDAVHFDVFGRVITMKLRALDSRFIPRSHNGFRPLRPRAYWLYTQNINRYRHWSSGWNGAVLGLGRCPWSPGAVTTRDRQAGPTGSPRSRWACPPQCECADDRSTADVSRVQPGWRRRGWPLMGVTQLCIPQRPGGRGERGSRFFLQTSVYTRTVIRQTRLVSWSNGARHRGKLVAPHSPGRPSSDHVLFSTL